MHVVSYCCLQQKYLASVLLFMVQVGVCCHQLVHHPWKTKVDDVLMPDAIMAPLPLSFHPFSKGFHNYPLQGSRVFPLLGAHGRKFVDHMRLVDL